MAFVTLPIPTLIVPNAPPRGYSYLEDVPKFFQEELDKTKLPSDNIWAAALRDVVIDQALKGKLGR